MFKHILITTMLVTLIAACGSSPKTKPKADEAPCDTSALKANSAMLGAYQSPLCDVNEEPECESNSDCPGAEFCTDGTCALQEGICESDSECGTGKECQEGSCVDISKDTVKGECSSNGDCENGEKCSSDKLCVKKTTTTTTDACNFEGDTTEFTLNCDDVGTTTKEFGKLYAHCTLGKTDVAWTIVKPTSIVNDKTTNNKNSIQTFQVGATTFNECKDIADNNKTITVTACDHTKPTVCTDTKQITLTAIVSDPTITDPTNDASLEFTFGTDLSKKFTATGGSKEYTWAIDGALPGGLGFDAATGTLSGIPTVIGEFPITITVTDKVTQKTATATAKINIKDNFTVKVWRVISTETSTGTNTDGTTYEYTNPVFTKDTNGNTIFASTTQATDITATVAETDIVLQYGERIVMQASGGSEKYKWTLKTAPDFLSLSNGDESFNGEAGRNDFIGLYLGVTKNEENYTSVHYEEALSAISVEIVNVNDESQKATVTFKSITFGGSICETPFNIEIVDQSPSDDITKKEYKINVTGNSSKITDYTWEVRSVSTVVRMSNGTETSCEGAEGSVDGDGLKFGGRNEWFISTNNMILSTSADRLSYDIAKCKPDPYEKATIVEKVVVKAVGTDANCSGSQVASTQFIDVETEIPGVDNEKLDTRNDLHFYGVVEVEDQFSGCEVSFNIRNGDGTTIAGTASPQLEYDYWGDETDKYDSFDFVSFPKESINTKDIGSIWFYWYDDSVGVYMDVNIDDARIFTPFYMTANTSDTGWFDGDDGANDKFLATIKKNSGGGTYWQVRCFPFDKDPTKGCY